MQLLSDIFLFAFPFVLFASEDSSNQDIYNVFRVGTKEGTISFLLWQKFHSFKVEPPPVLRALHAFVGKIAISICIDERIFVEKINLGNCVEEIRVVSC